jgi:hypothetical protein
MKKYLLGTIAIVLAISFVTLSAFSESRKKVTYEPTVRFFQSGTWSSSDETLTDAEVSSGCPNGTAAECARFYDINHLNLTTNPITVKTDPMTGQPYQPDEILKYDQ